MPTTAEQIESLMEEQDLKFFTKGDDAWIIPFKSYFVSLRLLEDGEYLRFYGSKLADLEALTPEESQAALEHFMKLNDQIMMGRFCGYPDVGFEIGLPLEDGELTSAQFHRCLRTTSRTTATERYMPAPVSANLLREPFLLSETPRLPSAGD